MTEACAARDRFCSNAVAVKATRLMLGPTGGTGGIVAEARRRKMPLAWVHAGNRQPGTLEPTSLGEEQGKVSFENFPTAG